MKSIGLLSLLITVCGGSLSDSLTDAADKASIFELTDSTIKYYSTKDYPPFYQSLFTNAVETFADDFWRVGPTHIFLFKDETDWVDTSYSSLPAFGQYEQLYLILDSREEVNDYYRDNIFMANGGWSPTLSGSASWNITGPINHLTNTMVSSPGSLADDGSVKDHSQNFVVFAIHEYVHLTNHAYGFDKMIVKSNRQGESLWKGPSWFVEGMASFVATYYSYLTPELMDKIDFKMDWSQFSSKMNHYLNNYVNEGDNIRNGVTYNDWHRLESEGGKKLYSTVYCGGAVAVVLMMKSSEDLEDLMSIFPLMHQHGFEEAFEMKYNKTIEEFYDEFDSFVENADISLDAPSDENSWIGHLD